MKLIAGFTINKNIHIGQTTKTYRAQKNSNKHPVIIKILNETYPSMDALARFKYEYELLGRLKGQGTVAAYELETYGNSLAIVMEDFGNTLHHLMAQQTLSLEKKLVLALEIIQALEIIHNHNIIHKDINPYNILVDEAVQHVKIIDFSISSTLSREEPELQNPLLLEGMLYYISPEQTGRMNRGVDYRSDYYSLGCVFYELFTGKVPFESEDAIELVHSHIAKLPQSPHEVNPNVPQVLSGIILKLMAKNVEQRYQSLFGLKKDLEKCLEEIKANGKITFFSIGTDDIPQRFQISEKLYGRESEIESLVQAFEQASRGKAELVLVSGYSGIGKSRIIQEIYKPVLEKRGHFIRGKCDQFKSNKPYDCFIQALEELVKQILSDSNEQISKWRNKILAELGSNVQIAIDMIPSLSTIMGKHATPAKLEPIESQQRLNHVLQGFIRASATMDHPLAIFLDDLQWIDNGSLRLLEVLLTNDNQNFLIIGAYRDNEVDEVHPLSITLDSLKKNNVIITKLMLKPLQLVHVKQLLADSFYKKLSDVNLLACICLEKTKGNPFYLRQFLKQLYKDSLIQFNDKDGNWYWNIDLIQKKNFTDNVANFMTEKVRELPPSTQECLKLAACIGTYFDLQTLAVISQQSTKEVAQALEPALEDRLITPLDEAYKYINDIPSHNVRYKFLHDRIEMAAYSLIEENQRALIHLSIGRLLLANFNPETNKEKSLDIVNHYNKGIKLITNAAEKNAVIQLNLSVAQQVKASSAYQFAPNYLKAAISLIQEDSWEKSYDLTLALYLEAAEAAYVTNEYDFMSQLIDTVIAKAKTFLDKISVIQLRLTYLTGKSEYDEAINLSLSVLKSLGVNIPNRINKFRLVLSLLHTRFSLLGKNMNDLYRLPRMTDPTAKAIMDILYQASLCAWIVNPKMLALLVFMAVRLTLKHGLSPVSSMFFVCYGSILSELNQINTGYQFGQLGLRLANRPEQDPAKIPNINVIYNALIAYRHENIHELLPKVLQVYQATVNVGNLEMATRSLAFYFIFLFYSGCELTNFVKKAKEYSRFLLKTNQMKIYYLICGLWSTALTLMGHKKENILKETGFDEASVLAFLLETKDLIRLQVAYMNLALINYLKDDIVQASRYTDLMLACVSQTPAARVYSVFYSSLIFLANYTNLSSSEKKKVIKIVKANLKRLKQYSKYAPMNYLNKYYLILAELKRIQGSKNKAEHCYDKAIELGRKNNFINEEAIANELAAKFYLSLNKPKIAKIYLIDSYYAYSRWGANFKLKQLTKQYPELLMNNSPLEIIEENEILTKNTPLSTRSGSAKKEILDLASILKSTQTISKEVFLPNLLRKLISILIESAGAQKGYILLEKNEKWFIEAEGAIDAETTILGSTPIESKLPTSIINYVIHDKTSVVINDATQINQFSNDPYIKNNSPKSLVCMPLLNKNNLSGIMYLENNVATNVFTKERIDLLNLLSGQIVISIDNSRLYSAYERFVPKEFLKLLKKKSIIDVTIGDHIEKDMTILFSDMRKFTTLSETMSPTENFNFINEFLSYVDPLIKSHQGFIDKYLGDGIMALFPDSPDSALQSAIDMLHFLDDYNVVRAKEDKPTIHIGIGINSGLLMLGTVGGEHRMDGTVISDAVNVASRVQDLTKLYKVPLLITEDTCSRLKNLNQFNIRKIDNVLVKGKTRFITIYEVFDADLPQIKNLKINTKNQFNEGISLYYQKRFVEAFAIFENILKINPNDFPAKVYYQRCKDKSSVNVLSSLKTPYSDL